MNLEFIFDYNFGTRDASLVFSKIFKNEGTQYSIKKLNILLKGYFFLLKFII